jgi:MFS family permease
MVATRVLNGIGASAAPGLGAATVCDLYFLHERGFYMGIYTVSQFFKYHK